jgi:hypothetical protein
MAAELFSFVTDGGANKLVITFSGGTRDNFFLSISFDLMAFVQLP